MNQNELYHFGIKGMRWGVRRNRSSGSTSSKKKTKGMSSDEKARIARKNDVKNRRTLSDADIEKKIRRLRSEQELKRLTEQDLNPGRKAVSDILASGGKKVLTAAAAGTMAYAVKVAMTKDFDIKEAAAYVAPKPKNK